MFLNSSQSLFFITSVMGEKVVFLCEMGLMLIRVTLAPPPALCGA